ncbi:MAG: hypothetical protein JF618_10285, partial [Leifsonia sp.]|nr:hypothetical protein [Leifsonia sp.]
MGPLIATVLTAAGLAAAIVAMQAPGRTSPELDAAAGAFETADLRVRVERAPQRVAAGFDGASRWSVRGRTVGPHASIPVSVL